MSQIGYYRFKTKVQDGKDVTLYKNGIEASVATIKALDYCSEGVIIKYLDSTGQYRFFTFNRYYSANDNPKQIGSTNEFITNIRTDQSNRKNVGYKNERKWQLATEVTKEQLPFFTDIYTSPRVYLYIGVTPSDIESDWLEVTIQGDNPVRRRKATSGLINITATLPEWYTIRMV